MTAPGPAPLRFEKVTRFDKFAFDIIVHPSPESRSIIINIPGYKGHIDGYNEKYRVLGRYLSAQKVAAFVQMPNITRQAFAYYDELVRDMDAAIEHVLSRAKSMCATEKPDLYLMGFSAGGSTVAAVAASYRQVKKILLMEPSANTVSGHLRHRLSDFRGEVYIVVGEGPEAIGEPAGALYRDGFSRASKKELVIIPGCDHQFRGTKNGQIMAKAPLWAFAGDTTFPSPDGGLVLY